MLPAANPVHYWRLPDNLPPLLRGQYAFGQASAKYVHVIYWSPVLAHAEVTIRPAQCGTPLAPEIRARVSYLETFLRQPADAEDQAPPEEVMPLLAAGGRFGSHYLALRGVTALTGSDLRFDDVARAVRKDKVLRVLHQDPSNASFYAVMKELWREAADLADLAHQLVESE